MVKRKRKKLVALRDKYSREGDGDRKRRAREKPGDGERKHRARKTPTEVKRKLESAVCMWELCREQQVSGRTLPGIADEKKSSRLFKVARRSKDSSDSESFEALEMELKIKFSVEDESLEMELKIKFSVEDESSVMPSGTETYDSD